MAQKRFHDHHEDDNSSPNSNRSTFRGQPVYRSNPVHDRLSTFTAIYSPSAVFISSPRVLQQHPDFKDASHRILAWRRRSKQLSLGFGGGDGANASARVNVGNGAAATARFETGSDDDGEKYAGRKVEAVLDRMGVEGVVVVARWYGGVMLGPVRFKWIEDCAGDAIRFAGGLVQSQESKRVKVGATAADGMDSEESAVALDESEEKQRLARILGQRDGSIDVLRLLLATRKEKLEEIQEIRLDNVQSTDAASVKNELNDKADPGSGVEKDEQPIAKSSFGSEPAETESKQGREDIEHKRADIPKPPQPNYVAMPLQRLKQLEKARDATISWILKQIDAAEEKLENEEKASLKKSSMIAGEIAEHDREEEEQMLRDFEEEHDAGRKS